MIVANRYKNCGDGTLESTTVAHNIGNLQMYDACWFSHIHLQGLCGGKNYVSGGMTQDLDLASFGAGLNKRQQVGIVGTNKLIQNIQNDAVLKLTDSLVFSNEPNGPGIHVGHVWNYVVFFAGLYYVEFFTHSSIDDVKSTLDSNTGVHIRFYEGKTVEDNLALGIVHGSFSQLSFAAKESSPDILTGALSMEFVVIQYSFRSDLIFGSTQARLWLPESFLV
eukprot:scaffold998_cov213-Chaetoceros_neogracile.AAC.3